MNIKTLFAGTMLYLGTQANATAQHTPDEVDTTQHTHSELQEIFGVLECAGLNDMQSCECGQSLYRHIVSERQLAPDSRVRVRLDYTDNNRDCAINDGDQFDVLTLICDSKSGVRTYIKAVRGDNGLFDTEVEKSHNGVTGPQNKMKIPLSEIAVELTNALENSDCTCIEANNTNGMQLSPYAVITTIPSNKIGG